MIRVFYFSPTGGTKKAAEAIAEGFSGKSQCIDILTAMPESYTYEKEDGIVLAAPVFAGRIPAVVREHLKNQIGNQNPAAVIGVYGNREFDDALVEMADWMKEQGFVTVLGAGVIAQHSLSPAVAPGRPDAEDKEELKEYGKKIEEIFTNGGYADMTDKLPGNRPYREAKTSPVCSLKTEACTGCGACAKVCPTQAISKEYFLVHQPEQCIMCKACVGVCPADARYLPKQFETMIRQKLSPLENIRKENKIFWEKER